MNYIDLKNFRKYEQLPGDSGPAKIGHVNYVIKGANTKLDKYEGPTYNINNLVAMTASEYAAITPDPDTIYFII
jgi:hypothetical protein